MAQNRSKFIIARRHVLFWGVVTFNGIGLCVQGLNWGEFALLPVQYEGLLSEAGA